MSSNCAEFWQGLAYKTYGHHLSLKNFSNVFDFIMAIAYKEQGAEQFEVRFTHLSLPMFVCFCCAFRSLFNRPQ